MPLLIQTQGDSEARRIALAPDREITFGRSEEADVLLGDKNASRLHARFAWVEGHPVLFDLGSSNGTHVNGLPITQITLLDGDTVSMGDEVFRYLEEGPIRQARTPAGEPKLKPGSGRMASLVPPDVTTQHLNLASPAVQLDALHDAYLKLKTLYRGLQSLSAAGTLEDLFRIGAEAILLSTPCDRVAIVLQSPSGQLEPVHQAWSHEHRQSSSSGKLAADTVAIDTDAVREVVKRQAPSFLFPDTAKGSSALATSSKFLGAPIRQGELIAGVVYCDTIISGRTLTKNDLDMVATLALQMSEPMQRLRQLDNLKAQQSLSLELGRDGLTIITRSPVMKPVMQMVRQVAPTDSIVLLQGESGTGKELLARALHSFSSRREAPFVAVNCAALPEGLIESELFGHEKGAFTGAFSRRPGKFEAAHGGTIFLDEIGELPMLAQSKLLRVLQEGEIQRVGSVNTIKVDSRVVCATNVNVEQAVREGRFREDLYYRVNVVAIRVPPLRDRFQDIPVLAQYYFDFFRRRIATSARELSPEAMQCMNQYHWPGNIRELRNVIERAVVLSHGSVIGPSDLPIEIANKHPSDRRTAVNGAATPGSEESTEDGKVCSLAEMEKRHIRTVMELTGGNKQKAAQLLGISRTTLYEKLKVYALEA